MYSLSHIYTNTHAHHISLIKFFIYSFLPYFCSYSPSSYLNQEHSFKLIPSFDWTWVSTQFIYILFTCIFSNTNILHIYLIQQWWIAPVRKCYPVFPSIGKELAQWHHFYFYLALSISTVVHFAWSYLANKNPGVWLSVLFSHTSRTILISQLCIF